MQWNLESTTKVGTQKSLFTNLLRSEWKHKLKIQNKADATDDPAAFVSRSGQPQASSSLLAPALTTRRESVYDTRLSFIQSVLRENHAHRTKHLQMLLANEIKLP